MASDLHKYSVQESLNLMMNTGEDALKVDIDNVTLKTEGSDINIEVHTDKAEDSMLMFSHTVKTGTGGTSYVPLVDSDGHLQVDIIAGSTATTEYSEDAATPSTISGIGVMMERDDALSSLTPAEGDWVAFRSSAEGALWTQEFNSDAILADTANMDTNLGTVVGHVDGIEGLLTTIDADTGAIKTAVEIIDNAISGSEMQVDVVTMPSVTVDSEFPAAATAADNFSNPSTTNVMSMGMVYDGSAWDRMLGDSTNGALVNLGSNNDVTVTGTVTANLSATDNAVLDTIDAVLDTIDADTGSIKTAIEIVDNVVHVDDAAFTLGSHSGVMMMGFAGTQSVDANDAGAIAMDTDGAIHIADGGNSITIDGTVTANLSATDNAVLDAMVVDLAALETLQTSTNTKLDTLETTLTAIETDQAAIEVLLTAANVDHAANEVLLGTIDADTNAIKTAVEIIDNAISGSEMQVDTVSTVQPAGFGSIGHGNNTDVSSSTAEAIAGSQACKHIDVMAAIANTGIIYAGGSGVTAATGIALYAGDVYSIDIDDVADVFVLSSVNGEDVQYVYYN